MFKNPSFLFDIVCTVVWLLLAVRYARKGFLAASVQLGGNVFSLVGARVFSGWAAAEVFEGSSAFWPGASVPKSRRASRPEGSWT